jgi:hypothetical protein
MERILCNVVVVGKDRMRDNSGAIFFTLDLRMIKFVRDLSLLKLENLEGFYYHQLKVDRNDLVNRRFITRPHGLIQSR